MESFDDYKNRVENACEQANESVPLWLIFLAVPLLFFQHIDYLFYIAIFLGVLAQVIWIARPFYTDIGERIVRIFVRRR